MKKSFVFVLGMVLSTVGLTGCKYFKPLDGPGMERDSADIAALDSMTAKAKEDIAGLIKELYAAAAQNESDIDQRFACHAWRDTVAAVEKKDANVPEIGFFNDDYWTMMQDDNPSDLEARDIKFEELDVEAGTALVDYTLYSSVQTIHQKLRFCREDGDWRVHDIIRFYNDSDDKEVQSSLMESMRSYLSVVDKHSEAYILQRIDTIYKFVGKITYDADGNRDYNYSPFNLDSAYCSERYYALMQQALAICEKTGDILYDYDYWVCGQDISDDWSYKVAKVYNVTDSTALVDMIIHNFSDRENTIALRFERDDWYIDDFSPSTDGNDDKAYLRRVIKQAKE